MPPVGFKRSRALWDDARRPRENKVEAWKSLLRAILYELQPVRFSQYNLSVSSMTSFVSTRVVPVLRQIGLFLTTRLPRMMFSTARHMTPRHWMILGGVLVYYFVVRWIHELLHAGPVVLILTALAAIFTVGLGENADGELSAYSVFNRGFQRLLGEVDADELANQYVGGMMGAGGNAAMMPPLIRDEAPENRNQRNNNNNNRAVARWPDNNPGFDDDDDDYNDDDDGGESSEDGDNVNNNDQQRRGGQSRKSGKKARRRPLEERREIRRQREAAQAMGLDGTGGEEEMVAMQRLIEDQVAAGDNQG